jgi:hypothetical protein
MATIVRTPAGKWKAVVRLSGWPTKCKTFRLKRDAQDWARHVEVEMAQGVFGDGNDSSGKDG